MLNLLKTVATKKKFTCFTLSLLFWVKFTTCIYSPHILLKLPPMDFIYLTFPLLYFILPHRYSWLIFDGSSPGIKISQIVLRLRKYQGICPYICSKYMLVYILIKVWKCKTLQMNWNGLRTKWRFLITGLILFTLASISKRPRDTGVSQSGFTWS